MVDAYEAIENDPKYVACCAPDTPNVKSPVKKS